MTIFNLTNDPSLMPTGEAIDLVRDILNSQCFDDHFFHERMHFFHDNPLFWTLVYGPECTDYEFSEQIPLFIVNREISGKNVYSRILQREIPVPKDFLPNIRISKSSEEENHDNQDKRKREERHDRRYIDEEPNQTVQFSADERVQFIDVWGMFTILHDYTNRTEMPAIFIWMDKIQEAVNHDRNTEWLFAKVYVHELAHALMHTGDFSTSDFYKWREESLANAYALSKINSYIFGCNDDDHPYPYPHHYALNKYHKDYGLLDFAKSVMRKQPDNYKLGIKIFEDLCKSGVEIYELMGNWMEIKEKQSLPPKELQDEWFKAVQTSNELDWETISDLDSYMGDECYKYNKKLYDSKRDVVFQVIKDYVNNNPGITSADLYSAFPATLNSKYNVFATWPQAANYDEQESLFKKNTPNYNHYHYNRNEDCIVNLADVELVVCDDWDEDFKKFVENANRLGYDIEILVD